MQDITLYGLEITSYRKLLCKLVRLVRFFCSGWAWAVGFCAAVTCSSKTSVHRLKPSTHIRVFDARRRDAARPSRATKVAPYTNFSSDCRSGSSHLLTCFIFFHEKTPIDAKNRLKISHPASQTAVFYVNYPCVLARPDQNSLQPATRRRNAHVSACWTSL